MAPRSRPTEHDIDRVGLLAEPVRRQLYELVASTPEAVSRDHAASALDIGRPLAAFHLDRLVEGGLLEVEYRRRSGRSGPGAGRPAKFYRRAADRQVDISLPARRYRLAAEILADGLDRAAEPAAMDGVRDAARATGRRLAHDAIGSQPPRAALMQVLTDGGFEPFEEQGVIRLRNCPFDALVQDHRDLTCGLNLTLLESVAAELPGTGLTPVRRPRDGLCCVEFVPERAT
ncbi:MAG TPA: helix-turn-helix domain-containing protein [Candidatus Limnocylindria bacterium]|jgi:predicted ArsR family transcriptional regulator|nr:helix-turn-helix domain-containing protein [Candidatus Limnocylindria bacterium]